MNFCMTKPGLSRSGQKAVFSLSIFRLGLTSVKFWPFFTSRSSQWPPYWARSFRSISDSRDLEPVFAILLEAKTSLDVAFKAQAFNEGKFLSSYFLQSSMSTAVNVGFSRPPQLRRLSCFELSAKDFLSAMSSRTLASNDLNCQPCL